MQRAPDSRPPEPNRVRYMEVALHEACRFLTDVQYLQLMDITQELKHFGNPDATSGMSIRKIRNLYELREKGGVFGRINVRVFFGFDSVTRTVWVVGAYKKEEDGATNPVVIETMQERFKRVVKAHQVRSR